MSYAKFDSMVASGQIKIKTYVVSQDIPYDTAKAIAEGKGFPKLIDRHIVTGDYIFGNLDPKAADTPLTEEWLLVNPLPAKQHNK